MKAEPQARPLAPARLHGRRLTDARGPVSGADRGSEAGE